MEMIQSLEQSKGKPYRIVLGKYQHTQILFTVPPKSAEITFQEIPR